MFTYENFGHALAGATAFVVSMTICYPLDTIRHRLQVGNGGKGANVFRIIQEIVRKDGIKPLYQGLGPVIISTFISNFVYFYVYQGLKSIWMTNTVSASGYLLLGIVAGAVNVLVTNPLWVVNTRIRLQGTASKTKKPHDNCNGIADGIIKIYQHEGIRALWAGTLPSLLLVLNPGIQFMIYELQKNYIQALFQTVELSAVVYFIMGAIAKMMATFSTYPLQIAQTRLRFSKSKTKVNPIFGLFQLLFQLIKVGGITSLYQGMEAKLYQTIINTALMFAFYEKLVILIFYLANLDLPNVTNKTF